MSRAGFTLLEVIVAIVVAAVLALLTHRGILVAFEVQRRATETRSAALESAAVRRQIVEWIRGAYLSNEVGDPLFLGTHETIDGSPADHLFFPIDARERTGPGSATIWLGIGSDALGGPKGLIATTSRTVAAASATQIARPSTIVLVPGATGVRIRYRFWTGENWAWTSDWMSSIRLPDQVELQVFGDSVPELLQVPIRAAPGGRQ